MGEDENFDDVIEEEGEEAWIAMDDYISRRHERLQDKNKSFISKFLGKGRRICVPSIFPRYYGGLLTWSLRRYMEKEGWETVRTLGYKGPEPVYTDVQTNCIKSENLLMNGQMLAKNDGCHFIVTIDLNPRGRSIVQVDGPAGNKEKIQQFIEGVNTIAREQNFYRGKKIEFSGHIRFLSLTDRSWDSIILDAGIKKDIKANTIDFLNRRECWAKYGIPQKRGILLIGEPGTGKTAICKSLLAEATGITCITTSSYDLDNDGYLTELYEIARDLCPCIVFMEDIDLIGQDRNELGYSRGSALISLLAILDGVEENKDIVTIATTNFLEKLDKAISERPSRFDRVIKLNLPSPAQRKEIISLLCKQIPLEEAAQDYIVRKADHCTPAQLQEIVYSLVIEHSEETSGDITKCLKFSVQDIDNIISKINGRKEHHLGFCISSTSNGHRQLQTRVIELG